MTKTKSKVQEYAEAIIIAILIALFIKAFVIQAFKIPSSSMIPTLQIGDHILVNKFIYGIKIPYFRQTLLNITEPEREDIIVFIYPEDRSKDFIKRIIGIGGDTIEIRNKKIFLNGLPFDDKHGVYKDDIIIPGSLQARDNYGPVTIPKGSYFVMGDNRDQSLDSRYWGFVEAKDILGKAFIIYWSWDREDNSVRWKRFGKLLK